MHTHTHVWCAIRACIVKKQCFLYVDFQVDYYVIKWHFFMNVLCVDAVGIEVNLFLTLTAHAREGYSSRPVCLSVTL